MDRNQQIEQILRSAGIYPGNWTRGANVVNRAAGAFPLGDAGPDLPAEFLGWSLG